MCFGNCMCHIRYFLCALQGCCVICHCERFVFGVVMFVGSDIGSWEICIGLGCVSDDVCLRLCVSFCVNMSMCGVCAVHEFDVCAYA